MFWVFCSCFGCFRGVLVVFQWCLGGIEGMVFSQVKMDVKGNAKLCYWGHILG